MARPGAQPCHSPFAEVGADRQGAGKAEELGFHLHGADQLVNTLIALCGGSVKFGVFEPGAGRTSDVPTHASHSPRGGCGSLRDACTPSA